MKRKFKLFATVASLCLCLALMAFGVYAATNVKYTASGSVSFTVNDVFVTVTNNMVKKIGTAQEEKVASDVESAQSYTVDGSSVKTGTDLAADCTYEDVVFTKTGDYIKYTTTIKNDGESPIKVKFVVTKPTDEAHLGATVTAQVTGEEAATPYTGDVKTLTNQQTITLVLTISLKNMESTLTADGSKWEVKGFASINETFAE